MMECVDSKNVGLNFARMAASRIACATLLATLMLVATAAAKKVAYIHGDVAADGTIPSGAAAAYDPMLLTDAGTKGCSEFKAMVEAEGYTISQHYDQATTLDAAFVSQFDVIVFGLHQKLWSVAEKAALDTWIRGGGGILMYSDSAAGGAFNIVGIKNTTGQSAVNNILSAYGMQVTVDQGGGTRAYRAPAGATNPIVWDRSVFEGEGVSPVAVDLSSDAQVLIPFDNDPDIKVSGSNLTIDAQNVTIANPVWATIAVRKLGEGHAMAIFDRQPLWNSGPGSDITKRNNREILRRIVRYLARDYGNSKEWIDLRLLGGSATALDLSYRQWRGGAGSPGYDYVARNNLFAVELSTTLAAGDWSRDADKVETIEIIPEPGGETERATVRILPDPARSSTFARAVIRPIVTILADAGMDTFVSQSGAAWLEGTVSGATSTTWSKASGPGTVTFVNASALQTTATFSQPGVYVLTLTADNGMTAQMDTVRVDVVAPADVQIAINCGGSAYAGINGFNYVADVHFTGGGADTFPGNPVAKTGDDPLYNYARSKTGFKNQGYSIPVPNGNYTVYLQFAETFFSANGARVFDMMLEGITVIEDLDLHATAPGKWVAYDRAFSTTVTDSSLDLFFTSSVNNPLINAIVVIRR
jgi:hypothetical protein